MTSEKKINILEGLLDERDQQIRELQKENAGLRETVDNYRDTDSAVKELRNIAKELRELKSQHKEINNEYRNIKNGYQKEMKRFFVGARKKGIK